MSYQPNNNEQKILEFWKQDQTFEKSVNERPEDKSYVFYDGPPFATGLPHYGHIVASLMKDVVPRYWTMKGYRVERRWGWDCHGLPIENIIEKELNLPSRKDIEEFGIDKFNEACRATVLKYAEEWKTTISRMGRWVDMENDYKTMDIEFMESTWWVFKSLWDRGYIYEGKKAMHICPRCVTALSNFEVTDGYKTVKDISVTAKFNITNGKEQLGVDGELFVLAWTTTPWTLPGNVLLAVNNDVAYVLVSFENATYIAAKELLEQVFEGKEYEVIDEKKGSELVGLTYEPLFPYFKHVDGAERGFRVVAADFVTTDDGTGVVHIAPAFGADDYEVYRAESAPFVQHVKMDGTFVEEVTDFAGMQVKPIEDPTRTDVEMIKWLAHNGRLFSKKKFEHSYPHCWRCDTPLLNYATSSWFVEVTKVKEQLLANNKEITWVPEHIKEGRFGKWLEGAKDWAISRTRFWGTPLPIWRSEDGEILCVGSVKELEELTGETVTDLHKHVIDTLVIKKDGKAYHRIPEVLDCWFESGSMPYGQMHYPFENKEKFEAGFPAEFIAEGQDQTRGWFYTLHVLATALTHGDNPAIPKVNTTPAFKNVIVNGIVLAEDGRKMSKRLKNYPDPMDVIEKYGADALRYYFVSSPVMHAESLNFSEKDVREMYNRVIGTLSNVLSFYELFAKELDVAHDESAASKSPHILDRWILAMTNKLVRNVTNGLDNYALAEASRPIVEFISELSQWYVRRSRDRFKGDNEKDKQYALATLRSVLLTLAKVMAPFTPFIAEHVHLSVTGNNKSVHLELWPEVDANAIDETVLSDMELARTVVEMGLSLRKDAGIKVRQPLGTFVVSAKTFDENLLPIIADELNVALVEFGDVQHGETWKTKEHNGVTVSLNTEITPELKKAGVVREIVRTINQLRKDLGLTIDDRVRVAYRTEDSFVEEVFAEYAEDIKRSVLADEMEHGGETEVSIENSAVWLTLTRV